MRKFILIVLVQVFYSSVCFSQTEEQIGKIPIGVAFPDKASEETMQMKPLLESKLVKLATEAGFSSYGGTSFFIYPNIVISSLDVAEGGMKNVYVVRGELYLTIMDNVNNTTYAAISYPFKGSATKKEVALRSAIQNIGFERVSSLFNEAKSKILGYFEQQKSTLFAKAEACAKNGEYDEAITWLMVIPEELTDIYAEALQRAQVIYDKRDEAARRQAIAERNSSNDAILTEASRLLAMHNSTEALKVLRDFQSGNSQQDATYSALIKKAEGQVSKAEREALRKEERSYQDNKRRENRAWSEYTKDKEHQRHIDNQEQRLKRQKVEALKQVACTYLRNNPSRVDYFRIRF